MSNILPPLFIPATDRKSSESLSTISLPPLSSWSDGYPAFSSFSSPPPGSSSSPMTPFSTESHVHSHIRSSPGIASEHDHYPNHLPSIWDRNDVQHPNVKSSYALPSFKSSFLNEASFPLSSRYDTSALYDGASTHFHEDRSCSPRDAAPHHSNTFYNTFYDSEEEGQDESAGFNLAGDSRATFFHTSAERGQWRHDPIPVRPHARSEMRKSLPTWSPPALPGLQLVSRPISEPAPSTSGLLYPSVLLDEHEDASEAPFTFPMSSDHQSMMCDARQNLPSLMSDRDTSPEQEEMQPSSPLPPSSPPLSHVSFPSSPMARSISPLSFAPSSPPPVSSSPLAFDSSEDHDESMDLDDETGIPVDLLEVVPTTGLEPTAARASEGKEETIHPLIAHDLDNGVSLSSPFAIVSSSSLPIPEVSLVTTEIKPIPIVLAETSNRIPAISQDVPLEAALSTSPADNPSKVTNCADDPTDRAPDIITDTLQQASKTDITTDDAAPAEHVVANDSMSIAPDVDLRSDKTVGKPAATNINHTASHNQERDDVEISDASMDTSTGEGASGVKNKVVKKKRLTTDNDGPPRKKARVKAAEKTQATSKREGKRRSEDEEPGDDRSISRVKKKKKGDRDVASEKQAREVSHTRSDALASTSKLPKSSHEPSPSKPKQHDSDTPELDAEITGMLIECMATSRASSLPISSLYKSVMECRPSLKAQRSEKEWVTVFRRVLRNGVAGSGVFGKVESSGKDDSDRPLEAQWFYVPERDSDQERAALIRSMMPRPAKRTETKKYKQYYYRPLEKISRWDAEDDI